MLRLYNTLSRQEEPFAPLRDNTVRMYACGLTVYNRGHIGNFRTYVCLDVLRRTLKYLCGYNVQQVVNYTDVDDKTIAGAQKAGMPLREYTDQWIRAFREDAARLGIETPEERIAAGKPGNKPLWARLVTRLSLAFALCALGYTILKFPGGPETIPRYFVKIGWFWFAAGAGVVTAAVVVVCGATVDEPNPRAPR